MNMTTREFVITNMKQNEEFGVEGYFLAKTLTNFDKSLYTKMHPGKKKTFIDDVLKVK